MTTAPDYFFHKGGMINLTRYLASHYGAQKVLVNVVSPGGIYNPRPLRPRNSSTDTTRSRCSAANCRRRGCASASACNPAANCCWRALRCSARYHKVARASCRIRQAWRPAELLLRAKCKLIGG